MDDSVPSMKRRFSDQALEPDGNMKGDEMTGRKRRQTIGGHVHTMSGDVTFIPTPLKKKVSLGSVAASAYYFSGLPKTPLSIAKRSLGSARKTNRNSQHAHEKVVNVEHAQMSLNASLTSTSVPVHIDSRQEHQEEIRQGDTMFNLSINDTSSSTESSDLMNRSVLSDTTELTASNFVLAATSRQKLMRLKMLQSGKENAIPSGQRREQKYSRDSPMQAILAEPAEEIPTSEKVSENVSPSTSPQSLRKLTLDIMHSRLQNEKHSAHKYVPEVKKAEPLLENTPTSNAETNEDVSGVNELLSEKDVSFGVSENQLDVSKASLDDLFDGLLGDQGSACSSQDSSSLLVSPNLSAVKQNTENDSFQLYTDDKSFTSPSTPGMSPIYTDVIKEVSCLSAYKKTAPKLTSTKLKSSPRRIVNLNSKDSPARNTRSAAKKLPVIDAIQKQRTNKEPTGLQQQLFPTKRRDNQVEITWLEEQKIRERVSGVAPKSILNSAKKKCYITDMVVRKTVAFGSPEAAEYRIGSPSVSLTPMPSVQAKAMFSIPRATSQEAVHSVSSNSSIMDEEEESVVGQPHVESESAEAAVAESIDDGLDTSSSSEGTFFTDSSFQENTIELESSLNGLVNLSMSCVALLRQSDESDRVESSAAHLIDSLEKSSTATDTNRCLSGETDREETETIQLEATVAGLLKASDADATLRELNAPHFSPVCETHCRQGHTPTQNMSSIEERSQSMRDIVLRSAPQHCGASTALPVWTSKDEEHTVDLEATIPSDIPANVPAAWTTDDEKDTTEMKMDTSTAVLTSDEENTVELEADMSALFAMASHDADCHDSLPAVRLADRFPMTGTLASKTNRMSFGQSVGLANGGQEEKQTTRSLDFGLSDSPASISGIRRKSVGSRKSFCLTRSSRVSVLMEDNLFAISPSAGEALFAQKHDEINDEPEQCLELFTMSSQEISQIAGFGVSACKVAKMPGFHWATDSLCKINGASSFQISDSIHSFAAAVCGEVEEKVLLSSNGQTCFDGLLQSIGDEKAHLQRWFRAAGRTEEVRAIAVAVRCAVELEWSDWERTVLDSLNIALLDVSDESDQESRKLDQCTALLDDVNEALSIAAGNLATRARRLRFERHEHTTKALANEIADLETELSDLDSRVVDLEENINSVGRIRQASEKRIFFGRGVEEYTVAADSSRGRFVSAKSISGICPILVDGSTISFFHSGFTPVSCVTSQLCIDGDRIRCNLIMDDKAGPNVGRRARLSNSSITYVTSRCTFISNVLRSEKPVQLEEAGRLIRELNRTLGRVEATAREITVLQKRFDVVVEKHPTGESSDFSVLVSFSGGATGNNSMTTRFNLNSSYPFGPLDVCFEGNCSGLDLSYFQRQLLKNAKPGFGYLSRACDVISLLQ